MRVIWSPLGKADLFEIIDRIALERPRAALGIYDRINARVGRLADFPFSGPESTRRPPLRQLTISGTPYLVFYRIDGDVVRVIAIFDGRRSD